MSEAPATSPEHKVIKRYTNRKLYDTIESRYVTLDEIADMVKGGIEVKIVDNRSKEDLTSVTLAQIVFEEEKKKSQMPLSMLRDIIRRPSEQISDFISTQVTPRVDAIAHELKTEAGQRMDWILGREGAAHELTPTALVQHSQKLFEGLQGRIDERIKLTMDSLVGSLPALGSDMAALLRRVEQLEQKLNELERGSEPAAAANPPAADKPRADVAPVEKAPPAKEDRADKSSSPAEKAPARVSKSSVG